LTRKVRLALLTVISLGLCSLATKPQQAKAQFAGMYPPINWSLLQEGSSNGSINTSGAPNSITIQGTDSQSGLAGSTRFITTARLSGIYKFAWDWSSTDPATPTQYDYPTFIRNGVQALFDKYTPGTQTQSGDQEYNLKSGDSFGFAVSSPNNLLGASNLTISNFLYPVFLSSSLQPYANNQSISLDALKNQRELILSQAGDCAHKGWLISNEPARSTGKQPSPPGKLCVFAEGGYASGTITGSANLGSYSTGNTSSAYGIEWKPSRPWAIGAAYGYGSTSLSNFNFQGTSAAINSDIHSASLYAVYKTASNWKLAALTGLSNFNYSAQRTFLDSIGNAAFTSNGYTAALQVSTELKLNRPFSGNNAPGGAIRIRPLLGIAWGSNQQAAFSETGQGLLLNVEGQSANSLLTTAGASIEAPIPLNSSKTTVLTPRLGVAYQYDALANSANNKSISATPQQSENISFTEIGQNRGANTIYLDLGADLQITQAFGVYAGVNYQAFNNGTQLGYQGGIKARF
jgi:hypothetical protein